MEKSEREMIRPLEISGRENVGAGVPSGSIVEDTDIERGMSVRRGEATAEGSGEIFS